MASAAGISEIIDTEALPRAVIDAKPPAWRRILGAIVFPQRVVYVDLSQSEGRRRLTEAHEIGHRIIPWHEESFLLDHEASLMAQTRDKLESEAYLAGSHLMFQAQHFMKTALDFRVTLATPILLSTQYRASIHATLRYYVENHPDDVAMIVTGRYQFSSGALPVA